MIKSAYIHIPFCKNICSYCDFCKVIYNEKWVDDYLISLENEIKINYKGEILNTLYIGGGTPSSLSVSQLKKLFSIINIFKLNNSFEFTIECNIEDITKEKLNLFKNNKVNRLSIGLESLNDKYLKYLNRTYKSDIIREKIILAKSYFNNINVDLIYAIDGQTLNELDEDLNKIIDLDVNHISCYSLMIEDNTILKCNNVKQIDDELDFKMYKLIDKKLKGKYNHYEISNYSKKGFESKANLTYWHNEEYYGFGLSASGYINNIRYTNTKNLSKYLNNDFKREEEILTVDDEMKYDMILNLRLKEGINIYKFNNKYGLDILKMNNIQDLIKKGYLKKNTYNIKINKKYLYVSNDILVNLI